MIGTLNHISLFSGYGGFDLGLTLARVDYRTVGYVEIDPFCQKILQQRMKDGVLDDAPIWADISAFNGTQYRGLADLVTAGFPCQPHSLAGQRRSDDQRNLWPDTLRVIGEMGVEWAIMENVPGILVGSDGRPPYGGAVVGELAEAGYDCEWRVISAADAGAPHLRNRWWLVAHAYQP